MSFFKIPFCLVFPIASLTLLGSDRSGMADFSAVFDAKISFRKNNYKQSRKRDRWWRYLPVRDRNKQCFALSQKRFVSWTERTTTCSSSISSTSCCFTFSLCWWWRFVSIFFSFLSSIMRTNGNKFDFRHYQSIRIGIAYSQRIVKADLWHLIDWISITTELYRHRLVNSKFLLTKTSTPLPEAIPSHPNCWMPAHAPHNSHIKQ